MNYCADVRQVSDIETQMTGSIKVNPRYILSCVVLMLEAFCMYGEIVGSGSVGWTFCLHGVLGSIVVPETKLLNSVLTLDFNLILQNTT